jgi:leucyl-tRNA synthetase
MPQWAGSCWYYIRFCDNQNGERFIDPAKEKYWLPVDLYIGGAEHAVLHLLYARFWHKVLFDRGHVSCPEPFARLVNQGMILGPIMYRGVKKDGEPYSAKESGIDFSMQFAGVVGVIDRQTRKEIQFEVEQLQESEVVKQGELFFWKSAPTVDIDARSYKMSKSRGNVINPDHVVKEYGADALRMYEMFMGPLEQVKPWSMAGVDGVYRFLGRVWRLIADDRADDVQLSAAVQDVPATPDQLRVLHKTIKAVTDDIEKLSFNTAISRMMEFTNEFTGYEVRPKSALEPFVLLLSPFAPHLAEELWQLLGHAQSLAYEPWPSYDPALLVEAEIEVPVQVNGKLRGRVKVLKDADQSAIEAAAKADSTVAQNLAGKTIAKVIFVPGKLLNFVVK